MRFTLVSAVLPLAATVAAIQVTEPKKGAEIDPSDSFTVKWDHVSTDATSFDLYLVNNAVYPPVDKKIASDIETSDGSYTVDSISGLEDGSGYQINLFSNEAQNTGILAQSEQFNVTGSDSTSSSTSSSSTSTHSSTTSSSTSTESPSSTSTSTGTTTTPAFTSASTTPAESTSSTTLTTGTTSATTTTGSSESSSAAATPSDASVSDVPDNGAGIMGAPVTTLAGLIGAALLFTL